jgi:hypothetical protein
MKGGVARKKDLHGGKVLQRRKGWSACMEGSRICTEGKVAW